MSPRAVIVALTGLLLLCLGLGSPAVASEYIRNYHSEIRLASSGRMTVTETITVRAEGDRIRRGIYRDFPLTFAGPDGRSHRVDFELLGVARDGAPEPYHTETIDGGIRIYMGSADVWLQPGEHVYAITYETDRQIRYFDSHDELFWNVTGTEWEFPILWASATVILPEGTTPEKTTSFTGTFGSKENNAESRVNGNRVEFATTRTLGAREGLTIGIMLRKGVIAPPSSATELFWTLGDWWNAILAAIGLVAVGAYFIWNWHRVGRDPARGIIIPRWDAPQGLSPALVNYVWNKTLASGVWNAFSAALLNLAVRGHVVLGDIGESVTVTRTKTDGTGLPPGEKAICRELDSKGDLTINKASGPRLKRLGDTFREAIEREHSGKYYRFNIGVTAIGMIMTVFFYLATIIFGTFDEQVLGAMIVPAVMFIFVSVFSFVLAPTAWRSQSRIFRYVAFAFLGVFWFSILLVLIVSGFAVMGLTQNPADVIAWLCSTLMLVIAVVFSTLMGAATPLGRQLTDGIEGLVLYLKMAEQDRMNLAGAPTMSPQHFETLLPYAVALNLEKPWSGSFQEWLDKAGATEAERYQPLWYNGRFDHARFGRQMGGFSSTLSSSIKSSLPPPPKSSSSGFSSGGSSGGGGGGGGGGGW